MSILSKLFGFLQPSPPPAPEGGLTETRSLVVDGEVRDYIISIPEGDPASLPVLLNFHGLGQTAEGQARMTDLHETGAERGFITIYAEADDRVWDFNDDPAYVQAVLDDAAAHFGVTLEDNVYLSGFSQGASFAMELAAQNPGAYEGVASVAGRFSNALAEPAEGVDVLMIHGLADRIVPFNSRFRADAVDTFRQWADWNEFDGQSPEVTRENAFVRRYEFDGGQDEAELDLITFTGQRLDAPWAPRLGHLWPDDRYGVDANEEIADFFGFGTPDSGDFMV